MLPFTVQIYGFCERKIFRKKQKTISRQMCEPTFHKRCTQVLRKNFNSALCNNANCYCHSCFVENVPSSEVNESPTNDQNQSKNSLTNIIITPNNNKSNLYNSCSSVDVPFHADNHRILINSKYFNIIEINALKIKKTISVFSI